MAKEHHSSGLLLLAAVAGPALLLLLLPQASSAGDDRVKMPLFLQAMVGHGSFYPKSVPQVMIGLKYLCFCKQWLAMAPSTSHQFRR
jgi:hypothetical protein